MWGRVEDVGTCVLDRDGIAGLSRNFREHIIEVDDLMRCALYKVSVYSNAA